MKEILGTYYMGMMLSSFPYLVEKLGEPLRNTITSKVDVEWVVTDGDRIFTVYNYKDGKNYLGDDGKSVERINSWCIGGKNPASWELLKEVFPDKVLFKKL